MIFNRTERDVSEAKRIIDEKVKSFIGLSDEEAEIVSRGIVSRETLNRIESKQSELYSLFRSIGYFGKPIETKEWVVGCFFKDEDLTRIIENNEALKEMFFSFKETPKRPSAKYSYQNFNAIEKILFDLEEMYGFVIENFKECDTFYCGEE